MSYLALDYYFSKVEIPTLREGDFTGFFPDIKATVPPDGSYIADKITTRLFQSFSDGFMKWVCYVAPTWVAGWTADASDEILQHIEVTVGDQKLPTPLDSTLTRDFDPLDPWGSSIRGEIKNAREMIDQGKPFPVGLFKGPQKKKKDDKEESTLEALGHNHQVVGIGYEEFPGNADGEFGLHVYDCNNPQIPMVLIMDPDSPKQLKLKRVAAGPASAAWKTYDGFFVNPRYVSQDVVSWITKRPVYSDLQATLKPSAVQVKDGDSLTVDVTVANDTSYPARFDELHIHVDVPGISSTDTLASSDGTIDPSGSASATVTLPNFKTGAAGAVPAIITARIKPKLIPTGEAAPDPGQGPIIGTASVVVMGAFP
jgi:hypothetical protein